MSKFYAFISCLIITSFVHAQNTDMPVKVTDMLRIRALNNVSAHKNGTAVFTVTSIEPDGENKNEYKYVTQLWINSTQGLKQLTARDNSSQPVISPDGKRVAFVRVADGRSQVFIISLDGGEAIQLTKHKYGASNPRWSPDGRQILFSSAISFRDLLGDTTLNPQRELPLWSVEKPGFSNNELLKPSKAKADPDGNMNEIRAYLNDNANDRKATVITKLNYLSETDISGEFNFNHFFIIDAIAGSSPVPVTKGFYRFNSANFTPDGKQLVLSGEIDSTDHPDRSLEGEIFLANRDGSSLRKILGEPGKNYNSPVVSPSGKWIAFQKGSIQFANVPELGIMPLQGQMNDMVIIPFDRIKSNITWSEDESSIYFTAQSNGGVPLFKASVTTKKVTQLTGPDDGINSFGIAGNKMFYVKSSVPSPFELYESDLNGKDNKLLSGFNEWVLQKQLSIPVKYSFKNEKGLEVEYWVMKPSNYEPGKKFPLLLEIHGGPSSMWGPGETSMWHEFQYFCSKGYGVVYCNPRGSGGYGTEFLRANVNDWGTGPSRDVLEALDRTISQGWADTSKLLITGGSYAGYLVAWIIANDHRFKAACSQRGVYDLATFFGEGNAWRLVPNYFGGYPWETATRATLQRESPINYVQNIRTPYIIFHGDNDRRTGFVQSEMLYKSLKVLGRPVEYVRHPGGTHELTRSGNNRQRIDQMLRTYEFFERFINK